MTTKIFTITVLVTSAFVFCISAQAPLRSISEKLDKVIIPQVRLEGVKGSVASKILSKQGVPIDIKFDPKAAEPLVTINANSIALRDVINSLAEQCQLKMLVESDRVFLAPATDTYFSDYITRSYRVPKSFVNDMTAFNSGKHPPGDAWHFMQQFMRYLPETQANFFKPNRLVIRNPPEQLIIVEDLIRAYQESDTNEGRR